MDSTAANEALETFIRSSNGINGRPPFITRSIKSLNCEFCPLSVLVFIGLNPLTPYAFVVLKSSIIIVRS